MQKLQTSMFECPADTELQECHDNARLHLHELERNKPIVIWYERTLSNVL